MKHLWLATTVLLVAPVASAQVHNNNYPGQVSPQNQEPGSVQRGSTLDSRRVLTNDAFRNNDPTRTGTFSEIQDNSDENNAQFRDRENANQRAADEDAFRSEARGSFGEDGDSFDENRRTRRNAADQGDARGSFDDDRNAQNDSFDDNANRNPGLRGPDANFRGADNALQGRGDAGRTRGRFERGQGVGSAVGPSSGDAAGMNTSPGTRGSAASTGN